jgi:tape measure domain-containing protein
MALRLGELYYDIDARTNGLDNATSRVNRSTDRMGSAFKKLGAIAAAAITIETARRVIMLADNYTSLQNKIRLVAKSQEDFNKIMEGLKNSADEVGVSLNTTASLYQRLSNATASLNYSSEDLIQITNTISKALIVSGANAEETSSAITQLSQGLAAGALRGEEFNSVSEASPRLLEALQVQLNMTRGELRAMAFDGKLTAEIITKALKDQASAIDEEFKQMQGTVGQSMERLKNAIQTAVGEFNNITGTTEGIADFISNIADMINNNWHDALIETLVFFKRIELETQGIRGILSDIFDIFVSLYKSDAVQGLLLILQKINGALEETFGSIVKVTKQVTGFISENVGETKKLTEQQKELNRLKAIELEIEQAKGMLSDTNGGSDPLSMMKERDNASIESYIQALQQEKNQIKENLGDFIISEQKKQEESKKTTEQLLEEYRKRLEARSKGEFKSKPVDIEQQVKLIKTLSSGSFDDVMSATGSFTDQPDIKSDKNDGELSQLIKSMMTENEQIEAQYKERKELIEKYGQELGDKEGEYLKRNQQMKDEAIEKHKKQQSVQEQQLATMHQMALVQSLSSITSLNDTILDAMEKGGKEQTAAYKALFYMNKAMQVTQMIVNAYVAGSNMAAMIPGPVGVGAGIAVTAAGIAQAAIVAGMTVSEGTGGGRLSGGGVYPNTMHPVNEDGNPEMLVQGNRKFLLTGSKAGTVIPANKMEAKEGASNNPTVTIVNNGAPLQVESQTFSKDEVILLVKNAEESAVNRVDTSIGSGRGSTSQALKRYSMSRRS